MHWQKQTQRNVCLSLILLSIILTGCARRVVLTPITTQDINIIQIDGEKYYQFSEWYFDKVLKVKLEEK